MKDGRTRIHVWPHGSVWGWQTHIGPHGTNPHTAPSRIEAIGAAIKAAGEDDLVIITGAIPHAPIN